FVFWKYPIKSDTKSLTLAALLVILAVVLKRFSIMIPLFGFESLKISVEVIPMLLAGVLLAPGYCFIIGLAVDWVGLIIAPTSFPFLGFTLSAVLQTLIPSIIVRNIKDDYSKYLEKVIKVVLVLLAVGACVYVFSLEQVTISKQVVDITFNIKVFISVLCVIMVSVLFMVMYY
ncbi:MAG: folate family ECF transporter S component, partial [Thomasclavelia ramosa]